MPVESAADRAVFVNTDDFGVASSYTLAAGGSASTINGIFDAAYAEVEVETEIGITSTGPAFICRTADLPSGYGAGDSIVIDSTTYKVRVFKPDGTGMSVLKLEKQ